MRAHSSDHKSRLFALLLSLCSAWPALGAAPNGILANKGKLKPVVTVANSSSEKVVKTFGGDADSGPIYEVQPGPEKVSAKVMALLGDYNFAGINADTEVALTVGDFSFAATLGEAGTRKLQATGNATFVLTMQVPILDADGGAKLDAEGDEMFSVVRLGTLNWAWSAANKTVTATLSLVIPGGGLADAAGVTGIASTQFAGLGQLILQGGERRFSNQPIPVSVSFGGETGSRDAFVTGVTRTRLVKVAGAEAPHLTTSVVLAGGADTRAPQLSVRVPAKWVEGTDIPLFAMLSDRPAPVGYSTPDLLGWVPPLVEVYVNQEPVDGALPDPRRTLGYSDSRGTALADGMPVLSGKGMGYLSGQRAAMGGGVQTLHFVALDSEGNRTVAIKNVSTVPEGFVLVSGGTLPASSELGAVSVSTFYIGKYEVQWGEFQTVRSWAAAHGYDIGTVGAGDGSDYPVTDVNWYQALKWCNARSEMEGRTPVYTVGGLVYRTGDQFPNVDASANGYRLPSEKEWEWAARGGTQSRGYAYSGSNDINAVAWYVSNSNGTTHVVGTKVANELGVYDMSGNVFEWCFDYHDDAMLRRVRGGSWDNDLNNSRVALRFGDFPYHPSIHRGFRLALSLVP
jgi:formylglycine-generating enzyme required for sulfatase activity